MNNSFPTSSSPSIVLFSAIFSFTIIVATATEPPVQRIVVKLIHRYSLYSDEIDHSNQWLSYFQTQLDVEANLLSMTSFLFISFSIGQPPTPQLAVMDTGSSLIWVQCSSCKICSHQNTLKYDPLKSFTYKPLPCEDPTCYYSSPLFNQCDYSLNQCAYTQTYLSGPSSRGIVATEHFTFRSSDEGVSTISDVVFGCGNENRHFNHDPPFTGVFGLGFRNSSILTNVRYKFSYCVGDITDRNYDHNVLILGDGAFFQGDSTPLEVVNSHYHLSLEGISVGDNRLKINPSIFMRKNTSNYLSGVVIDSGSPLTWLVQGAFDELLAEVKEMLDKWVRPVLSRRPRQMICYKGDLKLDLAGFPVVTFHFAGDSDLVLDTNSLFVQRRFDEFCFAFRPTRALTIIGLLAQQFYNLGFDLQKNMLFFQRIDCELLQE